MFGLINSIMITLYNCVVFLYNMLFFYPKSMRKTEGKEKTNSGLEYSQIALSIFMATNKTWRSQRQVTSHPEEALKHKYNKLLKQRLRDKALVDQAFEEVLQMETQCKEVQEAHHVAEELLQTKINQYKSEIEAKDKQLAKLKDEYYTFLDKLEKSHAADLEYTAQKAAEEQLQTEAAHLEEVRALTEASKVNRSAWEKAKRSMEADMKRMHHEYQDGLQANEDEITRVTELSYRLAAENRLLIGAFNKIPAEEMDKQVKEAFEEMHHTCEELDKTHTKLKIANEKIENILEAMQQQRDHYNVHGTKEQEAQAQVYDLHQEIIKLQEQLKLRDDLLCAANLIDNKSITTADAYAISNIALKNNELQVQLCVAQEANATLQAGINNVDDENCSLTMQLNILEADLHKAQERMRMLDEKQSLINKEHELLFSAVENNRALTVDDKKLLQKHLQEATACNDYLRGRNNELEHKLSELKGFADVVEDKCNTKIEKAYREAKFWWNMYWDEAVPKVERLTQEIHELNKELGRENVHVQEHLERNLVVANRNGLRYACRDTMTGINPDIIPTEYHEPGFVAGWIPATHDALRTLRPWGWAPVAELGKVWLTPMYKPFTQEDAAYRLQAEYQTERKEHRAKMNASPPPEAGYQKSVEASTSKSQSSHNAQQASQTVHEEPQAPAYNPKWMKMRSELTRSVYEDMDTDLKLGVLRMLRVEHMGQDSLDDESL